VIARREITGLVLAGGAGRRAGGRDKGLVQWRGELLVAHVVRLLRPEVGRLLISCNRNAAAYAALADLTVSDSRPGFQGPLAGLEATGRAVTTPWLVIAPCDTPRLPADLVPRLLQPLETGGVDIAWAHDGAREHYLCAALRSRCLADLPDWLDRGHRAVRHWYRNYRCATVDFSDQPAAFSNINQPLAGE
jgi:molybdopterin-guanine dinucleotide biosynthesis protein A